MHGMEKSLELHSILKMTEADMKNEVPHDLAVNKAGTKVKKGKGKGKCKVNKKAKDIAKYTGFSKANIVADSECFYCKGKRHWNRNCSKYLEDKKNENVSLH